MDMAIKKNIEISIALLDVPVEETTINRTPVKKLRVRSNVPWGKRNLWLCFWPENEHLLSRLILEPGRTYTVIGKAWYQLITPEAVVSEDGRYPFAEKAPYQHIEHKDLQTGLDEKFISELKDIGIL